jgi:hypothetical protein
MMMIIIIKIKNEMPISNNETRVGIIECKQQKDIKLKMRRCKLKSGVYKHA